MAQLNQGFIEMSRSEKFVDGLAVTFLFLGFVTGVIAKPMNKSPHQTEVTTHAAAPIQQNQETRRSLSHA
ncbi:MAG: hypothetical protein JO188_18690 [Hyphomicrobiales bacterium]|nr:hypothetical protein [Hyphomicrobiales bacterium]